MSEPAQPEPTMEEILASIRRIISEDDGEPQASSAAAHEAPATPAATPPAVEAENDDVLELTERVEPAQSEPATVAASAEPDDTVFAPEPETLGEIEGYPKTTEPEAQLMHDDGDKLVSEGSAHAATSAFGRLSAAISMPEQGRTLEDITKDLLRPMLKAWLDENLPRIVENKVAEEVERLSRGRVR